MTSNSNLTLNYNEADVLLEIIYCFHPPSQQYLHAKICCQEIFLVT